MIKPKHQGGKEVGTLLESYVRNRSVPQQKVISLMRFATDLSLRQDDAMFQQNQPRGI
jgi:hypothetical protein